MKFKIGDKVKFLNETGEGIITKIISSSMVGVSDEHGFEIPTMISNLIFADDYQQNTNDNEENEYIDGNTSNLNYTASKKATKGVYMAFIPHDQKWLIIGDIDISIINNTNCDVLYNIFLKNDDGTYSGIDYGSAANNSKIIIATLNRDNFTEWLRGVVQIFFHTAQCNEVPLPLHVPYKIKPAKLMKEDNYTENVFFAEKAFIYQLAEYEFEKTLEKKEVFDNDIIIKTSQTITEAVPKSFFIDKHKIDKETAEVDLHIEELTSDVHILTPHQILHIQKDYFMRCIDSAIAARYKKIIFIHGVGNGILKREIENYLHENEGFEFYDAPLAKYGFGATEVVIHYNILK